MNSIYVDYNATTPPDPEIAEIANEITRQRWGNPSSAHATGREARFHIDDCRCRLADLWSCKPSELIFTGGGTESVNTALFGAARLKKDHGRRILTTPIEHHAVLHSLEYLRKNEGFEIDYLPVDRLGRVHLDAVKEAVTPETILVSVMAANNETGVLQPVAEIGAWLREASVLFHTDAIQWFGKQPLDSIREFNADLVSLCAHKFHGPRGAGLLFARSPLLPEPILFGGGHENERRAGTENTGAIVGMTEAIARFTSKPVFDPETLGPWAQKLRETVEALDSVVVWTPDDGDALSNTLAFTVDGADGMTLIASLDLEGVAVSSGSACSAGSIEPSHVIRSIGGSESQANALVRISLGRENTLDQIDSLVSILPRAISSARGTL